jgi:hypothetical protein
MPKRKGIKKTKPVKKPAPKKGRGSGDIRWRADGTATWTVGR